MRLFALALVALALSAAPAIGYAPGDDISGQPEIVQALDDASGYWHGATANCPAGITVLVVDQQPGTVVAEASDCTIRIGIGYYSPPPDRGRYCALFAHEYGHLIGYGHEAYPQDTDGIMVNPVTPRYCLRITQPPVAALPGACRWPAWARATPSVRRLYAAGRAHAAREVFLRWHQKHPKARPGPCVAT